MITTDFSNQKYPVLAGLAVFLGTLMILLIPSGNFIKPQQNALYLASESRAYYPNNQEIILLSTQLEGLIKSELT